MKKHELKDRKIIVTRMLGLFFLNLIISNACHTFSNGLNIMDESGIMCITICVVLDYIYVICP